MLQRGNKTPLYKSNTKKANSALGTRKSGHM